MSKHSTIKQACVPKTLTEYQIHAALQVGRQ